MILLRASRGPSPPEPGGASVPPPKVSPWSPHHQPCPLCHRQITWFVTGCCRAGGRRGAALDRPRVTSTITPGPPPDLPRTTPRSPLDHPPMCSGSPRGSPRITPDHPRVTPGSPPGSSPGPSPDPPGITPWFTPGIPPNHPRVVPWIPPTSPLDPPGPPPNSPPGSTPDHPPLTPRRPLADPGTGSDGISGFRALSRRLFTPWGGSRSSGLTSASSASPRPGGHSRQGWGSPVSPRAHPAPPRPPSDPPNLGTIPLSPSEWSHSLKKPPQNSPNHPKSPQTDPRRGVPRPPHPGQGPQWGREGAKGGGCGAWGVPGAEGGGGTE